MAWTREAEILPQVIAVNRRGTAAGTIVIDGDTTLSGLPVRWDAAGTGVTVLGMLGTRADGTVQTAAAHAINDSGTIVGYVTQYSATHARVGDRVVRWDANSTAAVELSGITGSPYNVVSTGSSLRINVQGTISGAAYAADNRSHAVIWLPGSITPLDLNTLVPTGSAIVLSDIDGLSDTGWVTGSGVYDPDGAGGIAAYYKLYTMLVPQAGTYGRGDADFDADVDFNDLLTLARNYGKANASQSVNVADFDLDGDTDFADLLTLARHFNTSAALVAGATDESFAADWSLAQSLVPEPATLSVLVVAPLVAGRQRRRR